MVDSDLDIKNFQIQPTNLDRPHENGANYFAL
jgi:hypothetical protein